MLVSAFLALAVACSEGGSEVKNLETQIEGPAMVMFYTEN